MTNKAMELAAEVSALLRARTPIIQIVTREEARTERFLVEAAGAAGFRTATWDCAAGPRTINGQLMQLEQSDGTRRSDAAIEACLDGIAVLARKEGPSTVWIMRDLPVWLAPPIGIGPQRALRNLAKLLPIGDTAQSIIIVSPSRDVQPELVDHTTLLEWPLPDRNEMGEILDASLEVLPDSRQPAVAKALKPVRDDVIDAAIGLSDQEAQACFARSLVQFGKIEPGVIAKEKERVVARAGVLTYGKPLPGGLDSVGGLDNLKSWFRLRAQAFTPEAREYGLPAPRGVMLVGVPGCGKTLAARAIATALNAPLIKLDMGALKSKFVGDSEANLRRAFSVIEAVGRCVVLVDEIEKAMAGGTQGAADGGVSADALGSMLSWMQDRQGEAFVVATANNVEALPPELMRKGRFDEIFFVDVPTSIERMEVLKVSLAAHGRSKLKDMDGAKVVAATQGFTGAEIAALVPEALYAAFADGKREPVTADMVKAAKDTVPLTKTAEEKIAKLRKWAEGASRPASPPEADTADEDFVRKPRGGRGRILATV